jgi:drug/metabolite transporter (DMT)-like permease
LAGVAMLELYGSNDETERISGSNEALGDALAIASAVFMSACFYTTERILRDVNGQVLALTAVRVGVAAVASMMWCALDPWVGKSWTRSYGLLLSLFQKSMLPVALSILWTGLISTDLNFLLETTSLQTVSSSEAAVILATEPLWVVLLSLLFFKDSFDADDCIGGILMVAACLAAALEKASIKRCSFDSVKIDGQHGGDEVAQDL